MCRALPRFPWVIGSHGYLRIVISAAGVRRRAEISVRLAPKDEKVERLPEQLSD